METVFCPPVSAAAQISSEGPAITLFEIAGGLVQIESNDATLPGLAEHLAGYYCAPMHRSAAATPDATIRLRVEGFPSDIDSAFDRFEVSNSGVGYTDGHTCVFDFRDSRVIVRAGEPHQIDVLMRKELDLRRADELQVFNYAISTALRRCNLYELHSGAVVERRSQRGVLFVGPSGSGKSTLTLQLVANGWQYLTDDVLLLRNVSGVMKAYPLRRAFAVSQATVLAAGQDRVRTAFALADWPNGLKKRFLPSDFFPESFAPSCQPHAIFFPTISGEDQSIIRPLTRSETMAQLIKMCPWSCYDPVTSASHLQALSALARQCDGFIFLAGKDLLRDSTRASQLMLEHTSSRWQ